jgi:hypothetical protein
VLTLRMLIFVYRILGHRVVPIFKDEAMREEGLSLEDGTDRLSGNAGKQLPIYTA